MSARACLLAALVATLCAAPAAGAGEPTGDPDPRRSLAVLEYRAGSPALPAVDGRIVTLLRAKTSLAVVDAVEGRQRFGARLARRVADCAGEAACIARIGKKLGVSEVLLVGVSQFGDVILTLQRIDVAQVAVRARIAEALAPGREPDDAELLRWVRRVMPKADFLRWGVIRISANIAGAAVVIGEKTRGRTPIEPVRLPAPATYDIHLEKSGYVSFRASVEVPPDAVVRVDPVLTLKSRDAWYKRWWVLAIAGTVAAGAVTAAVLARDSPDDVPVVIQPF